MKKYIIKTMLIFALIFSFVLPVSAEGTETIPEERLFPRLVDDADLLTDAEEGTLQKQLDEISERQECDVVVATVNSLEGKSSRAYADDFFDYNGYGYGKNRDGILLLISMENRDWAISTCGYGITAFTDAGQEYIVDKFKPSLSDGDYAEAFAVFAEECDKFISQAQTGEPYDEGNLPTSGGGIWLGISLVLGFIIAFMMGMYQKSKLKSVIRNASADSYTTSGGIHLVVHRDNLINVTRTSRTIEKDTGGGSSTHKSSSGATHGGSSGKF